MCFVCKNYYNIHEKIAAHNYYEQMANYNGIQVKEFKKKKLTKKSLKTRIENSLIELQNDSDVKQTFLYDELNKLIIDKNNFKEIKNFNDLETINIKFQNIMMNYYQLKLKEQFKNAN